MSVVVVAFILKTVSGNIRLHNGELVVSGRSCKSFEILLHPSREREGPALQSGSNMAGRGGDVMCSRSGSGSGSGSGTTSGYLPLVVAASEEQKLKRRRRSFCLAGMKSRKSFGKQQPQQPAANNNNNTPLMKEIKHICSNCRGAETLDGERTQGRGVSCCWCPLPACRGPREQHPQQPLTLLLVAEFTLCWSLRN